MELIGVSPVSLNVKYKSLLEQYRSLIGSISISLILFNIKILLFLLE